MIKEKGFNDFQGENLFNFILFQKLDTSVLVDLEKIKPR